MISATVTISPHPHELQSLLTRINWMGCMPSPTLWPPQHSLISNHVLLASRPPRLSCAGHFTPQRAPAPPPPLAGHRCFHSACCRRRGPGSTLPATLLLPVICVPAPPPLTGHRCFHSTCCRRRGLGATSPRADSGLWFHCEECRRVHQVLATGCGSGACI